MSPSKILSLSVFVLAVSLIGPDSARAGKASCLTGTDPAVAGDAAALAAVRAAADAACPCATYDGTTGKTSKDYRDCAKAVVVAATPTSLRPPCKGVALKFFANSTCGGKPELHGEPCIETNVKTGKVSCRIKAQTKKDGSTPTNACVSSAKANKESCANDTHCIDAADRNGDLLIAAPGDAGHCRMDCAAQQSRDLVQCSAALAACNQYCVEHLGLTSCYDGCQIGRLICENFTTQARDACLADPGQGCDAIHTGSLGVCAATDWHAPCENAFFFDPYCYDSLTSYFADTCAARAGQAQAECRGLEPTQPSLQ